MTAFPANSFFQTQPNRQSACEISGLVPVSISVGVAELKGRSTDFSSLSDEADRAMYSAKQAGRNRIFFID
jgi:diguanylate cyclase (GGDEF)-like protein